MVILGVLVAIYYHNCVCEASIKSVAEGVIVCNLRLCAGLSD